MMIKCKICGVEFYMRPSDYKRGRRCCSQECGNQIKKYAEGSEHKNWKGEKVSYAGVHAYVKRHKQKPPRCEDCDKKTDLLDLANISQEYKRDLTDWEYLCRKCHMRKDGRIKSFIENASKGTGNRWKNRDKYSDRFPFNKI